MTVNAGLIPADHWTQDINVGGGRIVGEACHFIDLMRFFAGSEIVSIRLVVRAVLQLDNFRRLRGFGWPGFKKMNLWKQNKGQTECVRRFLATVAEGGKTPISVDEVFEVSRVSIEVAKLLRSQGI